MARQILHRQTLLIAGEMGSFDAILIDATHHLNLNTDHTPTLQPNIPKWTQQAKNFKLYIARCQHSSQNACQATTHPTTQPTSTEW